MSKQKLQIDILQPSRLGINVRGASSADISINKGSISGTRNYNNLINKPSINGIVLEGDRSVDDLGIVSENTEAGWAENPSYLPKRGEICLYSDTMRIKIGDGVITIVDLPFIDETAVDAVMAALQQHEDNPIIHVSQDDRDRWDAKLNYTTEDDILVLTRD